MDCTTWGCIRARLAGELCCWRLIDSSVCCLFSLSKISRSNLVNWKNYNWENFILRKANQTRSIKIYWTSSTYDLDQDIFIFFWRVKTRKSKFETITNDLSNISLYVGAELGTQHVLHLLPSRSHFSLEDIY